MPYTQTQTDLQKHFEEQLYFLESATDAFDTGQVVEAKRIAHHVRTIVHQTGSSHALLEQLGLLSSTNFVDTAYDVPIPPPDQKLVGPYTPLVTNLMGPPGTPVLAAPLDDRSTTKVLPFLAWWDKIVLIDSHGIKFARKNLILLTANKEGGSHVDPELEDFHADLVRNNSLGMIWSDNGADFKPVEAIELYSIRQIGHELLKTLKVGYSKKSGIPDDVGQSEAFHVFVPDTNVSSQLNTNISHVSSQNNIGRNDPCPCSSGKKWKKCGLLNTQEHQQLMSKK